MAIVEASAHLLGQLPSIWVLSFVSIPILVIFYYAAISVYNIWLHPLSKYPGPRLAAASPLWMVLSYFHGKTPTDLLKAHEKYGPVVRIGPSELSYINPIQWREIYGFKAHGHKEFSKDPIYHSGMKPNSAIINADKEHHSYVRKLLAHGFSETSLRDQEPVLKEFIDTMIRKLHEECRNGEQPLDIMTWYNFVVFDFIGYLTFGESFDCLTTGTLHTWVGIFFSQARSLSFAQMSTRLPYLLRRPFTHRFLPQKVKEDLKTIRALNVEKVGHRLKNQPPVPDFMDKLIEAFNSGKISPDQLEGNAEILIAAGSETTATALSGLTWLLLKNPRVLEKLKREIRTRFQHPDEITLAGVNECKYLLGCIEETLRVYPPSPQPHHRIIPAGGAMVNGEFLPAGTSVSIPIYAIANSPLNFAEPGSFIPERWTGEEEEDRFVHDKREALQPFSYGPRNCIGRNLAYAEMKLIMARLIWHFDIVNATDGDWMDQKVFMVWEKGPLWIKLKPVARG
ncbi:averantin oxidoreductase [Xylaria sp. FL0043]|nr:averantin oxidoreductase [Xylaria sp. FL0043]